MSLSPPFASPGLFSDASLFNPEVREDAQMRFESSMTRWQNCPPPSTPGLLHTMPGFQEHMRDAFRTPVVLETETAAPARTLKTDAPAPEPRAAAPAVGTLSAATLAVLRSLRHITQPSATK
jgi:hypothetical protein